MVKKTSNSDQPEQWTSFLKYFRPFRHTTKEGYQFFNVDPLNTIPKESTTKRKSVKKN